jgi:hypothetical protein
MQSNRPLRWSTRKRASSPRRHCPMKAMRCESFTLPWKVRRWWASKPPDQQWFLELLEELGIVCRMGRRAKIRAAETRKQKHDRRDARLMLNLLMREDGFPEIWMPSSEERDLRTLLRDRHQWVKIRTRVQNPLQAMALSDSEKPPAAVSRFMHLDEWLFVGALLRPRCGEPPLSQSLLALLGSSFRGRRRQSSTNQGPSHLRSTA